MKSAFNSPPSLVGTQKARHTIRDDKRTKMSWVIPTMSSRGQTASCFVGFAKFSREKPVRPVEVRTGSDLMPEIALRVTRISKWALVVLVSVSCASLLWRCRPAYAVESVSALAPQLSVKVRAVWGLLWPKIVQVFSVFRDQGLLISVLLALSAFFSMAETSIMTLWPWKVQELAEKEPEDGVFRLLRQDVTRFLTTILIGTTVANIGATALVTKAATALFGEAGISAATGVMTVVILLLTEITPKSIAVHNATEVARFVVRPVAWLSLVLYPVGRIVTALSMGMLKVLGLKSRSEPLVTEEELKLMLRGAELSGAIEEEEQDMIENVLEIKDTYVREVMTPLVDVVAIDAGASVMDFRNLWVTHQYSRVPVFEGRVDNIVGIAYAMDRLDYVEQIVTLEDVFEEIVGEIFDESDSKEEIRKKTGIIVHRADGVYDVDANTSIEDLAEALEVKLTESPYHYETVSGFVCEAFGYIPRTGESIRIVLQKENDEDSTDFGEGAMDHHEDQREKFQKYKLEILAGNAKKVDSVRFEAIDGEESKDHTVNRAFPRIVKRTWEGVYETFDYKEQSNSVTPIILSKNREMCQTPQVHPSNRYAIAENVDTDNTEAETRVVEISELTVIDPEDSHINVVEDADVHLEQTEDIDVTSTSSVSTLNQNWKQQEKKEEKKKKKRRKQPVEGSLGLDDQGTVDLGHSEAE